MMRPSLADKARKLWGALRGDAPSRPFDAVFRGALDAMLIADDRGRYLDGNPAALAMLGVTHEQLLALRVHDVLADATPEQTTAAFAAFLAAGSMEGRTQLRRPDGQLLDVEFRAKAHVSEGRHLSILRDVTERQAAEHARRQLEAQLAASDRMAVLGALTAGIVHEINNPLAAVVANLDLVEAHLGEPVNLPEARSRLADAQEATQRVAGIVGDVRLFSRHEPSTGRLVDVHEVLESTLRILGRVVQTRARVVREFASSVQVVADPARLGQVFLNLLVNAAQALPEGSPEQHTIHVRTQQADGRVRVEIADTGAGIAPEIMRKLFTPFVTTKPNGTGLGLSISRQIVESLHGEISARPNLPSGSVFCVELPAAHAGEAAS